MIFSNNEILDANKNLNNVFEFIEKSQELYKLYLQKLSSSNQIAKNINQFTQLYQGFLKMVMHNPQKVAETNKSFWHEYLDFMQFSLLCWAGKDTEEFDIKTHANDKRFTDPIWEQHPIFSFYRQFYLLSAKHLQSLVTKVDGIEEKTLKRVNFFINQFINAASPTHFIVTNPYVLQNTVKLAGGNLLKGFDHLIEDLNRNSENLQIKMTDLNAFQIGKNIAVTPGKIIYQNDLMQLIQYSPQTEQVYQRPLLIVPPWINKFYILDLSPENSFVKWLISCGYTVFMISWVNPNASHAHKNFQDYMLEGPLAALDIITKELGITQINAIGYCMGGTLLACTLAYLAAQNDNRIVTATYLATLLDFSNPGDIEIFIDEEQINFIEQQMQQKGYLDGSNLALIFNLLRSNDLIWSFFVKNYLQGEEPFPLDLLYWNSDSTNLPATMHSFYLRNMYLDNLLTIADGIKLNGVSINLKRINIPVCFISTEQDHIAPWQSTYVGTQLHSGIVKFILAGSGHIAGIINSPSKNKYNYFVNENHIPNNPDDFINDAQMYSGSWWPHWENWLRGYSDVQVKARHPQENKLSILEDAPGTYVLVRN